MQSAASATIGRRMPAGHSCAPAAASLRGSPRKAIPKALAKQAAARPPISASARIATMAGRPAAPDPGWSASQPNAPT